MIVARRAAVLAVALILAGCGSTAAPASTASPAVSQAVVLRSPVPQTPAATAPVSATPAPAPTPAPTPTAASLPALVGGRPLHVSYSVPIPDYWLTTGVASAAHLPKDAVTSFERGYDGADDLNALGTVGVVAIRFLGGTPAGLLSAFAVAASTSAGSVCRQCAFIHSTIAGRPVVIEEGMPKTKQPDGKLVWPGGRQYAYASGDVLYVFAAIDAKSAAELIAALP